MKVSFSLDEEEPSVTGFTSDVSEGGMFVQAARPAAIGSELRLEIEDEDRRFRLSGRVTSVRGQGMGVRFREGGDLPELKERVRSL